MVAESVFSSGPTHQGRRVELRDHVMEEGCQVSRPRLQELHTLKTAALTIHLPNPTERGEREREREEERERGRKREREENAMRFDLQIWPVYTGG